MIVRRCHDRGGQTCPPYRLAAGVYPASATMRGARRIARPGGSRVCEKYVHTRVHGVKLLNIHDFSKMGSNKRCTPYARLLAVVSRVKSYLPIDLQKIF